MTQAPSRASSAAPAAPRLSRDYWRLWWANAISSTGDGAFVAALPLLAVTITRDPRLVSVVAAATYLPWLLLSLPAGAVVDRYDRATLMWRAQAVQAAVVTIIVVLVVVHQASIETLAAAGFLLGSAEVIFSNAAQSILPALVPPELLPKANGSQQVSLTVGESFLGPPAGSLLFAAAAALPFGLDAASFAGSAALVARLPRTGHAPKTRKRQTPSAPRSAPRSPKACAGWPVTACSAWSPSCSASTTSPTRWARPSWSCWPPRRCTSAPAATGCSWPPPPWAAWSADW